MRMSMKPPPPMFPAGEWTTASAKPVATAASTAFPPACRISTPTRDAIWCTLTTMACSACSGCVDPRQVDAAETRPTSKTAMNDLCGNRMDIGGRRGLLRLAEGRGLSQIRAVPDLLTHPRILRNLKHLYNASVNPLQ